MSTSVIEPVTEWIAVAPGIDVSFTLTPDMIDQFDWVRELEKQQELMLSTGVSLTAAFLDEHVPGWYERIIKPLKMKSVYDCLLGQVFAPRRRRFGRKVELSLGTSGYTTGMRFLHDRNWVEQPFVFSSPKAVPYWEREIARRGAG